LCVPGGQGAIRHPPPPSSTPVPDPPSAGYTDFHIAWPEELSVPIRSTLSWNITIRKKCQIPVYLRILALFQIRDIPHLGALNLHPTVLTSSGQARCGIAGECQDRKDQLTLHASLEH
jgi:hypothetical protein